MNWHGMADRMLGIAVSTFAHATPDGQTLVKYIPKTGAPYDVTAVFDRAYVSIDPSTGVPISSNKPVIGVQLSAMQTQPRPGDRVNIGGELFNVSDLQPDGVAGALLVLHKV